ncbi:tyrosine--tRNA ligase [Alkalibacterium pelagium]|uniref:Tyrosine--tRNA ligase n=1 Tax=Alkalibacterium pelagium TaxID=426702 RepID=A0A1H7NXN5_9LACT|nr:tyrosine--tRNA ligase [Alkalibacterium pelagium]GEN51472.1 tyrosine--tRNA ligase 2 [Alkalibacterium pelagium]SEL28301.1 tyrosyl-tRNA synthetase [Alkalibacterium pelagium]
MTILDELEWRGAINQQTDEEGLKALTQEKSIALYCGIDPSGDSMHVGHLIPFMILKRFQLAGHKPVILIGGGTGSIGDPSGRNSERVLQTMDKIMDNADKLSAQMRKLFKAGSEESGIKLVNNYDWLSGLSFLDFLRDFGKEFNINTMLSKDVVSSRLDTGISFTEFSYQIIQSVDFLHLFQNEEVQLQIGGSDQWGNITAGLDLIRKKEGAEAKAFGLTIPLLLKADGTKFGKSADGAIWLDPEKTTPYEFYQFWFNQDDRDVVKYLKYFTFLSKEEIDELAEQVETEPHKRAAQKALAEEMTRFVHSQEALDEAISISQALFSGDIQNLTADQIATTFKDVPSSEAAKGEHNLVELLVDVTGIEPSRRQAREDIKNGAIRLKGSQIQDVDYVVSEKDSYDNRFIIVRKGKKKYFLINLV